MAEDIIAPLISSEGFPRISIYLPMHVRGNEIDENPIRLKNALRDIRHQLEASGMEDKPIDALLREATAKVEDHVYWRYQKPALGVFIEPDATRFIKLPGEVGELSVLANRYHVRPLIRLLRESGQFHILAVTRQNCRLFEADKLHMNEVKLEDMPDSIEAVRGRTDFEDNLGYHMRSSVGPRGGSSVPSYNAQGESPEDYDEVLLDHYIKDVAKSVEKYLSRLPSPAPLAVVADARTLGRLKRNLSATRPVEPIDTDPASMRDEQLLELCRETVAPWLDSERKNAAARLAMFAHDDPDVKGGRAIEDIWRACAQGRVATLFLAQDEVVWGRMDETTGVVAIAPQGKHDNEDVLNILTLKALAQGADVFVMPTEARSAIGPVAALYRY